MSDNNNKRVAHMSCFVFRRGQRIKAEGCKRTGAMHPWYSAGATGNKFDLTSLVKKPARQTNKVCQSASLDAAFG